MRYIVKATKLYMFDTNSIPYANIVYDGTNPSLAREKFLLYSQYGGTKIISKKADD